MEMVERMSCENDHDPEDDTGAEFCAACLEEACQVAEAEGQKEGRAEERAAIVADLRGLATCLDGFDPTTAEVLRDVLLSTAVRYELGEHAKEGG